MIESPYREDGEWLRGNIHTHTVVSPDSERPVANSVSDYEVRGYDFLALTDHDAFVDPADYRESTAMTLVGGTEVTDGGTHVIGLGVDGTVTPDPNRQAVLDAVVAADGLAVLPHPNWGPTFEHYSQAELEDLDGYTGIEVYNGASERGQGSPLATDRWDRLLSAGEVVWGYATDDSHHSNDVGRAWTVVQATEQSPEAILAALDAGRCYASTGEAIEEVAVDGDAVSVETTDATELRLVADYGTVHRVVESASATFDVPGDLRPDADASYVRVECLGSGGRAAWTQPFFLDGRTG
jgi:predicted metal-dependent phosphoesterase TrpH